MTNDKISIQYFKCTNDTYNCTGGGGKAALGDGQKLRTNTNNEANKDLNM